MDVKNRAVNQPVQVNPQRVKGDPPEGAKENSSPARGDLPAGKRYDPVELADAGTFPPKPNIGGVPQVSARYSPLGNNVSVTTPALNDFQYQLEDPYYNDEGKLLYTSVGANVQTIDNFLRTQSGQVNLTHSEPRGSFGVTVGAGNARIIAFDNNKINNVYQNTDTHNGVLLNAGVGGTVKVGERVNIQGSVQGGVVITDKNSKDGPKTVNPLAYGILNAEGSVNLVNRERFGLNVDVGVTKTNLVGYTFDAKNLTFNNPIDSELVSKTKTLYGGLTARVSTRAGNFYPNIKVNLAKNTFDNTDPAGPYTNHSKVVYPEVGVTFVPGGN